jgi:hypothetical protein
LKLQSFFSLCKASYCQTNKAMTMGTNQDVLMVMLKFAKQTPIFNLQDVACLVCVSKSIFNEIDIGNYTVQRCVIQCTINALSMRINSVDNICIDFPLFLTNIFKVQRCYGKTNYNKYIVKVLDDFATHDIHQISSCIEHCDILVMLTSICDIIQNTEANDAPVCVMSLFLLAHCTRKLLKKMQNEQDARYRYICGLRKMTSRLSITLNNAVCLRETITCFPYVFIERTLRSCNEVRKTLCNM